MATREFFLQEQHKLVKYRCPLIIRLFAGEGQRQDVVRASVQAAQLAGDGLLRAGVHGQQGLHLLAGQGQTHESAGGHGPQIH